MHTVEVLAICNEYWLVNCHNIELYELANCCQLCFDVQLTTSAVNEHKQT